jgi:hypothetical protein
VLAANKPEGSLPGGDRVRESRRSHRAFEWLSRGYRLRDTGMHWMKYDPLLKPLKNDPRFKALLAEMH